MPCRFRSLTSTQTSGRVPIASGISGQLPEAKEHPFSGVTNSGTVCRKGVGKRRSGGVWESGGSAGRSFHFLLDRRRIQIGTEGEEKKTNEQETNI